MYTFPQELLEQYLFVEYNKTSLLVYVMGKVLIGALGSTAAPESYRRYFNVNAN